LTEIGLVAANVCVLTANLRTTR